VPPPYLCYSRVLESGKGNKATKGRAAKGTPAKATKDTAAKRFKARKGTPAKGAVQSIYLQTHVQDYVIKLGFKYVTLHTDSL
jgi:hypothetical protein